MAPSRKDGAESPGRRRQTGYTLNELVVVMAMVAIIALLAIPAYSGARRVIYNNTALADLLAARIALQSGVSKIQASGTVVTLGPAAMSIAPQVRISRNVRLSVRRRNPTAAGDPQYTITATHTLGSATYTVTENGKIQATGARL